MQGAVRTLVLKTNPYFPFRSINRWPYHLALQAVIRAVQGERAVKALYLRHGVASRAWVPGLSDIDLSVVLARDCPVTREFDVVEEIHKRYCNLRRRFPMLGELEILSEADLPCWMPATCQAPQPRCWSLVHGMPVVDPALDKSPLWREKAINFALWVYVGLLPPCLGLPDSYLKRADVRRRLKKILRVLTPVLGESEEPGTELTVVHAARALEAAVARVDRSGPLRPGLTQAAIDLRDKVLLILPENLREAEMAAAMLAHREERPTIPLSASVFRYFVRHYNPYSYASLSRSPAIVAGDDPFGWMAPPERADFTVHIQSWLPHILAFTRGPELFTDGGALCFEEFEVEWWRAMALRLLLERDCVVFRHQEVDLYWRREFPETAQAFDRIKGASLRDAFELFRAQAEVLRVASAGLSRE